MSEVKESVTRFLEEQRRERESFVSRAVEKLSATGAALTAARDSGGPAPCVGAVLAEVAGELKVMVRAQMAGYRATSTALAREALRQTCLEAAERAENADPAALAKDLIVAATGAPSADMLAVDRLRTRLTMTLVPPDWPDRWATEYKFADADELRHAGAALRQIMLG